MGAPRCTAEDPRPGTLSSIAGALGASGGLCRGAGHPFGYNIKDTWQAPRVRVGGPLSGTHGQEECPGGGATGCSASLHSSLNTPQGESSCAAQPASPLRSQRSGCGDNPTVTSPLLCHLWN